VILADQQPRRSVAPCIVALVVLAFLGAMGLVWLRLPEHVAPHSPFETDRAMAHLRFIAAEPHALGSPHHHAVRDYLVRQFQELGLEVEIQNASVPASVLHGLSVEVMNVVARLRGADPTGKALMLAAHYDSTRLAESRGAGDDGAGVAALLEVARVLAQDPPRNDIIFLITDGEELGMLGARAFVKEHPWREDVDVVLNFEARGTRGPSIMFETSQPTGWLVEQYAQVAPHPVSASLTESVYRLMPNRTDFTIFKQAGMRGLNFAFIGGHANYHTVNDDLAHLDPRSVRHHGVQALALARRFGSLDLNAPDQSRDAIYFNFPFPGTYIVRYRAACALPFAAATAALSLLAAVLVARRKLLTFRGVAWSFAAFLLCVAIAVGLTWTLLRFMSKPGLERNANVAIGGFALLALACIGLIVLLFRNRARGDELFVTWLLICSILALATSIWMRGASFIVTWPAMFGAISFIVRSLIRSNRNWTRAVIMTIGLLPLALLAPPMIYLAFLGLRVRSAPVLMPIVILALWGLIVPLRSLIPPYRAGEGLVPQSRPHPERLQNP
jgi:hypothetical protein